ncbi:MAG: type II toxin-antitoxin system RelE/ParE family toxin [Methylomonas sp.]|jgi:plasmid stabilization system protein ParE
MVIWTAHAKIQLRHIYDYIVQDSALYARRITEELIRKTKDIDEYPR